MMKLSNHDIDEYYELTQKLLRKLNLTLESVDKQLDELVESLGDSNVDEAYLVLMYLCTYIEDFQEYNEEQKEWFRHVAERCFYLRKEDESIECAEGIC